MNNDMQIVMVDHCKVETTKPGDTFSKEGKVWEFVRLVAEGEMTDNEGQVVKNYRQNKWWCQLAT